MTRAAWAAAYIGMPFVERGRDAHGVDCWGLVRLVYEREFGLVLPSYTENYVTITDAEEIHLIVEHERARPVWSEVPLAAALDGDVLVIRLLGRPIHVGVVVDAPWFLHVTQGINTTLERWDQPIWARRLVGCYRHARLRRAGED